MRTPLSTPIRFPIASPRDLLSKARRELDRLTDSVEGAWAESNPIVIADQTINAAWSLCHVTDWIGNNDDPAVARVVPERIKFTERERTEAFPAPTSQRVGRLGDLLESGAAVQAFRTRA